MEILTLILLGVVGLTVYGIYQGRQDAEKKKSNEARLDRAHQLDYRFVSFYDQSFLGFKFSAEKIVIGVGEVERSYHFRQIAAAEVERNGTTITATNRGSQLLGAAIGGAVFGGVGALAGALSGSTRASDKLRELAIKVTIDDPRMPVQRVLFFRWDAGKKGLDPTGIIKPIVDQCDTAYAHLVNAMRKATSNSTAGGPPRSTADELGKLWDLRKAGVLTAHEFEAQKARVLMPEQTSRFD
jgi:hypothetical protein